ncbi:response regulator transcription factor [Streptomyces albiaxialis]|uniref:Response regulator transcription factor n=1 Tax=Streptomyces albiaxialis TaxID=329523 RepID=A0ABN2WBG2_9ACTN
MTDTTSATPAEAGGTEGTIRVLIADDQALLRGSFRVLIEAEPGLTVVGEAGTGAAAVEQVRRHRPDVVLMDIRMPEMDGIEATRALRGTGVRVVMLTMFGLDEYVFAALRAGASGFLLKDIPPAELLHAIRVVAAGESLLSPSVTSRLIAEFCTQPEQAPRVPATLTSLSRREREILLLVARGLTNADIAQKLRVSPATVKSHISHLFNKLDVRDRVQLVILGYECGLIRPGVGSGTV